ncbi:hypothetical protein BDZ45DRAFT_341889 [Acephala macrosclerotiorum]|nr:hypothetical protein BDZ45DRAFT_341889 [Acephala macrosclerotiorum]
MGRRIVEKGDEPASMAMLITVGLLVPFQIHTKAGFGTKEHMDGLEALVNTRGGLDALSEESNLSMAVAWFVAWTDNIAAIFFNTPPRFKLIPSVTKCEPCVAAKPPHILAQRYEAKLTKLTGSKSQTQQLIELYQGLHGVLPLPKALADKMGARGQLPQVVFYKNQLDCIERRHSNSPN